MSKIRNRDKARNRYREQNNNKNGCHVCVDCELAFKSKSAIQVRLSL